MAEHATECWDCGAPLKGGHTVEDCAARLKAQRDQLRTRVTALESLVRWWVECPFHATREFCEECQRRASAALAEGGRDG